MKFSKRKKGFTLIELLVVVAIIGVLASVVLASLSSARSKARDAKRVAELRSLRTALETYYIENGKYPGPSTGWARYRSNLTDTSCPTVADSIWTSSGVFDSNFTNTYMSTLPEDPQGFCYMYITNINSTGTGWRCYTPTDTINPNDYYWTLFFKAETGLSNFTYPGLNSSGSTWRCLLGSIK
jgi:type II secretion system protein G